jgi:hypothetical protein
MALAQDETERQAIAAGAGVPFASKTAMPDLDPAEEAEHRRLVKAAKAALQPEAEAAAEAWLKEEGAKLGEGGEELLKAALETRTLSGGFTLVFDDDALGTVTVEEILAAPGRYNGETLADPIDGVEYGTGKAKLFLNRDGSVIVNSYAHGGGRIFRLQRPAGDEKPEGEARKAFFRAIIDAAVDKLNERYFVAFLGGSGVIASLMRDEMLGRERLVFSKPADFRLLYSNQQIQVGETKDGDPIHANVADVWLRNRRRRTYDGGIQLIPKGPVPDNVYNLWRGFGVEPKTGAWPTINEFLRHVICAGDEAHFAWLLRWMAYCVQHPERQAEVAFVMRGLKGIGKGSFAKIMRGIFRAHYLHISNGKHLTGHFNAHLTDCLCLFVDEAFWAGDKQAEGVLKAIITEDTLMIEPKGHNSFTLPNRLKILIASNNDWVVPATADERRFFVLEVSAHRKGDEPYWTALNAAIAGAELPALLHHLLALDLSTFDHRNPPHTTGLGQQKLVGGDSVQRFWQECLMAECIVHATEHWPRHLEKETLRQAIIKFAHDHGDRHPPSGKATTQKLARLMPGGALETRRIATGDKRAWSYEFPDVETCREAFLKALNINPDGFSWE